MKASAAKTQSGLTPAPKSQPDQGSQVRGAAAERADKPRKLTHGDRDAMKADPPKPIAAKASATKADASKMAAAKVADAVGKPAKAKTAVPDAVPADRSAAPTPTTRGSVASATARRPARPTPAKPAASTDDPTLSALAEAAVAAPARTPHTPSIGVLPHEPTSHKTEPVKISTAAKKTADDIIAEPAPATSAPASSAVPQVTSPEPLPASAPRAAPSDAAPDRVPDGATNRAVAADAPEAVPEAVTQAAPPATDAPAAAAPAPIGIPTAPPVRHGGPQRGYAPSRGMTGRPGQRPPISAEVADEDEDEDEDGPPRLRLPATIETFAEGDHVVYPTHGVGKVEKIAVEEIAGHKLELIHITFEENRMTLRVPVAKARSAGLRKLATRKMFDEALAVLKGRARIKRTMWSRRAQEYEAKINSGDPLAIAEVVRDLHRNAGQPDQSFSERQIYEAAMDRLAAELAALDETDKMTAATKLANFLKTV